MVLWNASVVTVSLLMGSRGIITVRRLAFVCGVQSEVAV